MIEENYIKFLEENNIFSLFLLLCIYFWWQCIWMLMYWQFTSLCVHNNFTHPYSNLNNVDCVDSNRIQLESTLLFEISWDTLLQKCELKNIRLHSNRVRKRNVGFVRVILHLHNAIYDVKSFISQFLLLICFIRSFVSKCITIKNMSIIKLES